MPRRSAYTVSGGCGECGGICGGARTPKELMEMVLQHVEDGRMTGGQVARVIEDYTASGMQGGSFFGDLWKGIKKVASPLASVAKMGLSLVPLPGAQIASRALGALGAGRRVTRKPRVTRKAGTRKPIKRRLF